MKEEWRVIPSYPKYEASNTGFIRHGRLKNNHHPIVNYKGYLQTSVTDENNVSCSALVHILVAEAFFGERSGELVINHKNLIKADNSIDNLEYISQVDNMKHAWRNGVFGRGAESPMAKFTWNEIAELRRLAKSGVSRKYLMRKYDIGKGHLSDIINNNLYVV